MHSDEFVTVGYLERVLATLDGMFAERLRQLGADQHQAEEQRKRWEPSHAVADQVGLAQLRELTWARARLSDAREAISAAVSE